MAQQNASRSIPSYMFSNILLALPHEKLLMRLRNCHSLAVISVVVIFIHISGIREDQKIIFGRVISLFPQHLPPLHLMLSSRFPNIGNLQTCLILDSGCVLSTYKVKDNKPIFEVWVLPPPFSPSSLHLYFFGANKTSTFRAQ